MATITRYDSSRGVSSLQDEVERAFRQAFGGMTAGATPAGAFSPALDVEEDEEAFVLHVQLPGVRPGEVDGERVEASYRDGLLTITVPKAEDAKPRRIQVQTS